MSCIQGILLILTLSPAIISSLTYCELAIIRCCDASSHTKALPLRCFEKNFCPGLYWYGRKACSPHIVAQARSSLTNTSPKQERKNNPKQTTTKTPKASSKVPARNPNDIPDEGPPTPCELAIVRCCDPRQSYVLPYRCLEVNGCPGLYWQGRRTCS